MEDISEGERGSWRRLSSNVEMGTQRIERGTGDHEGFPFGLTWVKGGTEQDGQEGEVFLGYPSMGEETRRGRMRAFIPVESDARCDENLGAFSSGE